METPVNKKFVLALLVFGSLPMNGMFRMLRPVAQRVAQSRVFARLQPTKSIPSPLALSELRKQFVSKGLARCGARAKFFTAKFPRNRFLLPTTVALSGLILGSHAYAKFKKE